MPVQAGSLIEIEIDKPTAGGRMLGRHDGQVVLAWGAVPGERVRARVERTGKGVIYAETVDVVRASADRRPVSVDWRCGGNVLSHVEYGRQLRLKGEIIQDAFRRIGRVPLPDVPDVTGSPEAGYRMRARLHVDRGRLGFYREGSHQLCDPAATAQLLPSTSLWIARTEEILRRDRLEGIAGIEIAENLGGDERACHLDLHSGTDVGPFAALGEGLVGLSAQRADRADVDVLAGNPAITDVLSIRDTPAATVTLRRDVRAFFQGNRFLLETLARCVAELVPASASVVDLYAGVGLFGLALAARGFEDLTLIEGDPVSASDLKRNAQPFAGARVRARSVEAYLASADRTAVATTFIVDPPRSGLSKEAVAGIIRLAPATIVYVSCDVATLARDTRALLDAGYTLGSLRAFDLFPNTGHVETVASFEDSTPPRA